VKNKKPKHFISALVILISMTISSLCYADFQDDLSGLKKTSNAFNRVAEKSIPSVVNIGTVRVIKSNRFGNPFYEVFGEDPFGYFPNSPDREYRQQGLGSGIIVSKKGHVLTNFHVIKDVDEITITLHDKRKIRAKVIGTDRNTDLALLQIEAKKLNPIKFSDSDKIAVGDWAIAVGSPFGLSESVTVGVISAKGRSNTNIVDYSDLIQTDAAINPGNSGGALLNINGDLIGINTAIYSKSGGYMGIGFAIPANMAKKVMTDLINNGKVIRGWLGVYIEPITEDTKRKFGLDSTNGALVNDVIPGSPADKGGLKKNDIILRFNNNKIDDFGNLKSKLAETQIGKRIKLSVERNREQHNIIVLIEAHPNELAAQNAPKFDQLGLNVDDLTKKGQTNRSAKSFGAIITAVKKGSGAAQSGLRPGDIIVEFQKSGIRNAGDYQSLLKSVNKGDHILLFVQNNGVARFVVIVVN
jgi:serine protease Do